MINVTRAVTVLVILFLFALPAMAGEFKELRERNVRVVYSSSYKGLAEIAADVVAEGREKIADKLGFNLGGPVNVYLAESDYHFNRILEKTGTGRVHEWAAAVAVASKRTIIIKIKSLRYVGTGNVRQTIHHEIVHLFLGDMDIPLWLNEGLAEYASGRELSSDEELYLERVGKGKGLFSLRSIAGKFPEDGEKARLAYLQSAAFVKYLYETVGTDKMHQVLAEIRSGTGTELAFQRVTGLKISIYFERFAKKLASEHSMLKDVVTSLGLWGYMAIAVIIAFMVISIRNRRRLREMEREEYPF